MKGLHSIVTALLALLIASPVCCCAAEASEPAESSSCCASDESAPAPEKEAPGRCDCDCDDPRAEAKPALLPTDPSDQAVPVTADDDWISPARVVTLVDRPTAAVRHAPPWDYCARYARWLL